MDETVDRRTARVPEADFILGGRSNCRMIQKTRIDSVPADLRIYDDPPFQPRTGKTRKGRRYIEQWIDPSKMKTADICKGYRTVDAGV